MDEKKLKTGPEDLFKTVVRDLHFWIPLLVLLAGLLFLYALR